MNTRIKELAEQCWDKRPEGQLHFDNEKFAELIVLECSSICYRGLENGDEAASLLMNTFGVEE
jgi:hypothetical protein